MSFLLKLIPVLMVHAFLVIMILIAIDTLLGFAVALKTGTWKWSAVGRFLETSVLYKLIPLTATAALVLAINQPYLLAAFYTAATSAAVALVADIGTKLGNFGLKIVIPSQPVNFGPTNNTQTKISESSTDNANTPSGG